MKRAFLRSRPCSSGVPGKPVTDGVRARLGLTVEQKAALVAFLHTLTDHEMVKDPKFSDPFVRRTSLPGKP